MAMPIGQTTIDILMVMDRKSPLRAHPSVPATKTNPFQPPPFLCVSATALARHFFSFNNFSASSFVILLAFVTGRSGEELPSFVT